MTESVGVLEIAPSQKQIGQLTQAGRFNSASRHKIGADIRDRFESSASDSPHLRPRPFVVPSDSQAPTERRQAEAGKRRAAADHRHQLAAGHKRREAGADRKLQEAVADHQRPEEAGHKRRAAADHKRPVAADNIQESAGSNQAVGCWRWRYR